MTKVVSIKALKYEQMFVEPSIVTKIIKNFQSTFSLNVTIE
jgi:hypothetical protein